MKENNFPIDEIIRGMPIDWLQGLSFRQVYEILKRACNNNDLLMDFLQTAQVYLDQDMENDSP